MARNADALIKTQGSRKDFVFVGGGNATKQAKVFAQLAKTELSEVCVDEYALSAHGEV